MNKYNVALRQDWCKGCYFCIDVCPVAGIFSKAEEIGSRGFQPVVVNPDGCTGCELCELLCPDLAITVSVEEANHEGTKKVESPVLLERGEGELLR